MGRKLQYTTLDRVLSKIYRDLGLEEISETDVVEWTGEALEAIGAITLYEEAVAFVEIENHQADLPNGLHAIIQIAKDNTWVKKEDKCSLINIQLDCTTQEVENNTCNTCQDTVPNCGVALDCKGNPISLEDRAYYRPYFDLQYEYYGWTNSNMYRNHFTPVRLANHTFFHSIVCPEDEEIYKNNLYCATYNHDEYTIVQDKIRTSFKEGYIAISYYRQMIDIETGYPMIPDEYSIITAITMYITMKYMGRLWYMGREGYGDKFQKAEQDWQWYCKQAGNKQMMLYGIDQHENFKDMRHQLIPKQNRYYGFFGKMGRPENTSFKDPNKRNFRFRGI